jgi:hypothetical protein
MAALPPYSFAILLCFVCIITMSDMAIIEHLSRLHVMAGGDGAKKRGGRGKEGASVTAQDAELRTTANATGSKHQAPKAPSRLVLNSPITTAHFFTEPLRPT